MIKLALQLFILFHFTNILQAQAPVITKVNKSGDDAEVFSTNKVNFSSGDLELHGKDGSKLLETFIRFEGLTIEDLAMVTSAHLEFHAASASTLASQVMIKGEIGNSLAYPTSTSATSGTQMKGRTYTSQSVLWNTTFTVVNQKYTSPDIKSLLANMITGNSLTNGNLAFRILGNYQGSFNMLSFNGSTTQAPALVLNFAPNGGGGGGGYGIESDPANMTQLYINEISAEGTLTDADQDDWIELYNNHDYPIYLNQGVFISDKKSDLFVHELTGITIPAKGYYTLLANDKEELGTKNLPFELKNKGEKVFLTRVTSGIAFRQDSVDTPDIDFNESFGRLPNGTGIWTRFIKPSYNASNSTGIVNVPVDFSHKRGLHPTSFNLTIDIPANTDARYTLDGKTPSKTIGTLYTGPIPINKNTMVRVYAYDSGTANSGVRTHTFIIEDKYSVDKSYAWVGSGITSWKNPTKLTATEYIQSLRKYPIVSIGSDTDPTTTTIKTVSVEYIDNHLDVNSENYVTTAGCSEFGQTTIGMESANLKLRFKTDYKSKKIDYNIFEEIEGEKYAPTNKSGELDLKEGSDTPHRSSYSTSGEGITKFNDYFIFNLMKQMGAWAPATRFVHCYINGKYHGLKTLREGFDSRNLENYFGGDDDQYTLVNLQDDDQFLEGEVAEGLESLWDGLRDDIEDSNYQAVKNRVEIEDYIRMSMLYIMFDTETEAKAIGHNQMPEFTKFRFILSDNDGALWNRRLFSCHNYRYKWNLDCGMAGTGELLGHFTGAEQLGVSSSINYANVGNLEFKTKLKDEILRHMQTPGGVLTVSSLNTFLDSIRTEVAIGLKMDVAYLGNSNNYNNWNADVTRYKNEMQARFDFTIQKWTQKALTHTLLPATIQSFDEIPIETPIEMTDPNTNTTLYYTKDGSDPMGNDGAVSPLALAYTSPVTLPIGTYTIVTRAFKTNNWGPLTHKAVKVIGANKPSNEGANKENADNKIDQRASQDAENSFSQSIQIYPNPVYSEMHIDFKEMLAGTFEFLLYNQEGKLELAKILQNTNNTIQTFYLKSGSYFGVLSGNGEKHAFRVVKR